MRGEMPEAKSRRAPKVDLPVVLSQWSSEGGAVPSCGLRRVGQTLIDFISFPVFLQLGPDVTQSQEVQSSVKKAPFSNKWVQKGSFSEPKRTEEISREDGAWEGDSIKLFMDSYELWGSRLTYTCEYLTLNSELQIFEDSIIRQNTAQIPDWSLDSRQRIDPKSITEALKTELTLKPQPTEGWLELAA